MADKKLEIKITADDKELEQSLKSVENAIKKFAKQSAKVSIDVNTATALNNIKRVSDELSKISGSKKTSFSFVYGNALQNINRVLDKLTKLDKYKNIKVGLDVASNVSKYLSNIDKVKSKNININVNMNGVAEATKKLNDLYNIISKFKKVNNISIDTQIKDIGKVSLAPKQGGSSELKAQETSLRQIAKNYAGLAEQAWMDGDLKSFSQYQDMFRVAMNDLVNFKRALGDLSVGGEKTVYSNMARSLKDTSPLYNDIIKKVSQLDFEQKKFNDDVRNVGDAKQQYKTLSTALREVTKEAERAWSVGDKKGFGIAKSQFNDISSLMTQLRKELGTLTVEQEIRSYEKMLRGMSATNPWLAVLKSKLEELYKEKAELDKIKNDIKAKLVPEKDTITTPTAPRTRADYAKTLTALQQNVVARAEDYNRVFGTSEAEKAKKAYEGALTALLKFKQQQQGMLSYSSQKAVYNSVAPKIQKDSQAYELLRKRIQEATNATKALNSTQGDKGALFGDAAQRANYLVGAIGRASKGWGSAGEAISFFLTRLSQATGVLGTFAKALSVAVAGLTTFVAGIWIWSKAVGIATSVLQTMGNALLTVLKPGYETFVQTTKGVLSLSAALRTMGNYQGQVVTKSQAMSAAVNLMNQAMYRAQQSAFSYQEIVQALQGVLPLVLGKGMNAQQALDITTGVAGVAKLTGLNQNQILQETRDLMQGTITARTSQVANALGISNEDLAKYKANSTELFNFLMERFKAYSEVLEAYSNTVPGSIEQLQETIANAGLVIIDSFGGQIVSVVKTITNSILEFTDSKGTIVDSDKKIIASSEQYTDSLGKQHSIIGLVMDAEKGLVDELGNVVVSMEEVKKQGLGLDPKTTRAKLTKPMQEFLEVLKDVGDYILLVALNFVEWLKAQEYIKDTGDKIKDVGEAVKFLIKFVAESIKVWLDLSSVLLSVAYAMMKVAKYTSAFMKVKHGNMKGGLADMQDALDTDKQEEKAREKLNEIESNLMSRAKGYKSLAEVNKEAEEKGIKLSAITGNQKQDEKANKEALKQAQKAFDAQKEELKNALDDIKEIISKQMKSLDTMFEQGLMTAEDYYARKIELETQQAQADVDYYNKLIELTNKRPYEYEEDRQKELLKLNRELTKAVAKLEDIGLTQKELVKLTKESSEIAYSMNQLGKPSSDLAVQQLSSYNQSSGQFSGLSSSDIDYLVRKSIEYGVDARLVAALISKESGGNQSAVSEAGAIGIGQLMPATARELGVDPYDKLQNIDGTIRYLAQMLQRFGGDVSKALAAYNAGAGAVESYGGVPPYKETQAYVNNVLSTYQGMTNFGVIDTRVVEYGNKAQTQLGGYIVQANEPNYLEGGFDSRYIGKWESSLGATDLEGVQDFVVSAFNMAVNEYMGSTGQQDKVIITGGAEKGYHAGGTYSHENGYKLDIDPNSIKYLDKFLDIFSKYGFAIGDEGTHYDLSAYGAGTGGNLLRTPTTSLTSRVGDIKNYSDVAQKEALKIKQAFEKQQEEMLSIMQEWNKLFSGGYEAERVAITRKYNKQIHEYEEKITKTKDKNLQDELTQTKQRLIDIRDFKIANIDYNEIKEKLEYQFKDLNRSIKFLGAKLASGLGDVTHNIVTGAQAVGKYFENYFSSDSPINAEINNLVEQAALAQKQGSLEAYWQRMDSIDSIFKTYTDNINTALDDIDATYKHRIDMLDYSDMSNMQIDERKSILKSLEAQSKVDIYTEQLNKYIQYRNELQAKIDEMAESDRKDKEQLIAVWQTLVDKINLEYIPATERAIELNSKIAHIPTLLEKVRKTAKDALEDGLVEFLTDGINECENLGDAFRNLVISILKELQKLFAKEMVTGLMDMWFGKKEDRADVSKYGKQASPYDDESYTIRSIDYNAWYRQQNPYTSPAYNPLANMSWQSKDKDWLNQEQKNNQFDFSMSQLDSQFGYVGNTLNKLSSSVQQSTQEFDFNYATVSKNSQVVANSTGLIAPIGQSLTQASTAVTTASSSTSSFTAGLREATIALKDLAVALNNAKANIANISASMTSGSTSISGGFSGGFGGNFISDFFGSYWPQLAASAYAAYELFAGDTKERLLSMLFLETQNIYKYVSMCAMYLADIDSNTAGIESNTNEQVATQSSTTTTMPAYISDGMMTTLPSGITNGSVVNGGQIGNDTNFIGNILNSDIFKNILNFANNILGSAGAQLAGVGFAVKNFIDGDNKDKMLSLIYVELQLIYQYISFIANFTSTYLPYLYNVAVAMDSLCSSTQRHATGGYISGRGTGTSDSIPAMLSNGEFVIKASSVKKYGTNFLNAVNSGSFSRIPVRMPKFAGGGIVNEGIENTARGMTDFAKNIGTNVSTTNRINLALVRNEDEAMEHFMRSGAGQRAMLDFTRKNASFIGKITRSY